jgi:hypothetical protein
MEFLKRSQSDRTLSAEVAEAVEKGGMTTAKAVMRIAKKAGYSFTAEQFETAVRKSLVDRYRAGETGLASTVNAHAALESSCSKGCLSYTKSWHPDPVVEAPVKR